MATLKTYVDDEVTQFKAARASRSGDDASTALAWAALERAHILSQPNAWLHTAVHWHMLCYGIQVGDVREVMGQIARILVAALGSALGKAPIGNTGRSNVGIMQVMPVPPEIAAKLDAALRN